MKELMMELETCLGLGKNLNKEYISHYEFYVLLSSM